MIPASSVTDAACLAALRGLPHLDTLPTAADLEGYARLVLAQAARTPERRRPLRGEVRLYLRARREQRRQDREQAARDLWDARLAVRAAELAAAILPEAGAALLALVRTHLAAVERQAGAVLAA